MQNIKPKSLPATNHKVRQLLTQITPPPSLTLTLKY